MTDRSTTRHPMYRAISGTLLLVTLAAAAAAGCASGGSSRAATGPAAPPRTSGFLGDYSRLTPSHDDEDLLWYEAEDFDWRDYRRIMIDPLQVHLPPTSRAESIDPDRIRALTETFRGAVQDSLGDVYPIVQTPADDVLRIRAAITDLDPARPGVNILTALLLPVRFDLGGAAIEVELLDAVTGKRMAAMVDRKRGSHFNAWRGFSKWGDTRSAFRQWAEELAAALATNPEPPPMNERTPHRARGNRPAER